MNGWLWEKRVALESTPFGQCYRLHKRRPHSRLTSTRESKTITRTISRAHFSNAFQWATQCGEQTRAGTRMQLISEESDERYQWIIGNSLLLLADQKIAHGWRVAHLAYHTCWVTSTHTPTVCAKKRLADRIGALDYSFLCKALSDALVRLHSSSWTLSNSFAVLIIANRTHL